ncbi:MAG TPA: hypothetical protein DCY27_02920 [Desulfobacterales bacterium]|nr:hypothetical protein [Desulfobacterales bacterium]
MPSLSSFYGIVIRVYYDDHPPPHFHAYYGDDEILVAIDSLEILQGSFPKRALAMTIEWAIEHRDELKENWRLAEEHRPLLAIGALR